MERTLLLLTGCSRRRAHFLRREYIIEDVPQRTKAAPRTARRHRRFPIAIETRAESRIENDILFFIDGHPDVSSFANRFY